MHSAVFMRDLKGWYNLRMGLFVKQNENRSQLQQRIAAELREKAKQQAASAEPVDQSTDSNYVKDMNQTSERAWLWVVVVGVLVAAAAVFIITR